MSTQQVAFESPFRPDTTLTGERKGKTWRAGTIRPFVRVDVDGKTFVVSQDDIR